MWEVDGSSSESCPLAGFVISGFEIPENQLIIYCISVRNNHVLQEAGKSFKTRIKSVIL
jgi:hypothetical protein